MKKKSPLSPLNDWNQSQPVPYSHSEIARELSKTTKCSNVSVGRWCRGDEPREKYMEAIGKLIGRKVSRAEWIA